MHLKISKKLEKELKRIRRDGESDENLIIRMLKKYSIGKLPDTARAEIKKYLKMPNRPIYEEICRLVTYKYADGRIRHVTIGTISNIKKEMEMEEE